MGRTDTTRAKYGKGLDCGRLPVLLVKGETQPEGRLVVPPPQRGRPMASSVLVVNEISTEREEIARALEAEGFTVVQASSAAEAVREIWGGSFIVAVVSTLLTGTTSTALVQQLGQMAPEIETLVHGKNDELPALVRKCIQIREGEAAA